MLASAIFALFATYWVAASVCEGSLQAPRHLLGNHLQFSNQESSRVLDLIDGEPIVEIEIGTPGQKFKLLADTFGSLTWLCSASSEAVDCKRHSKYASSDSSTYKANGNRLDWSIGVGKLEGFKSVDTINLADISVQNQTLIEIDKSNAAWFAGANYDGFLGLGFNPNGLVSGLNSTVSEFSIWFSQDDGPRRGELALGGIDLRKFTGELAITELIPKTTTWVFQLESVATSGSQSSLVCEKGCRAIIETSSKKITGPTQDIARLHEALGAKQQDDHYGRYVFPSCEPDAIPSLVFQISNKYFELPAKQFVSNQLVNGKWTCYSLLERSKSSNWHLGMPFLRHHYIFFNFQGHLGIATSK